jgi:hypothetical protein
MPLRRRIVPASARIGEKSGIRWFGTVSFERANFNHPFAAAAIYYNDEAGIRAMAGTAWECRVPVLAEPAAALVTIELRDQSGRMLPGMIVGDRWFVVGEKGRRYSIVVRNRSDFRLEIVRSVDRLDVIDGRLSLRSGVRILRR